MSKQTKKETCKLVGRVCREVREQNGVPITTLAYITGYTHANIVAFENGQNNNLYLFLHYLKIDNNIIDYLGLKPEEDIEV